VCDGLWFKQLSNFWCVCLEQLDALTPHHLGTLFNVLDCPLAVGYVSFSKSLGFRSADLIVVVVNLVCECRH